MARINLVVWNNRAGFTRDAQLVQDLLEEAGHTVDWHHLAPPNVATRLRYYLGRRQPLYDLTIFFQNVVKEWLPLTRRSVLIPNPEHFGSSGVPLVPELDAVFCKTYSAVDTFRALNERTRFVGFTSLDRRDGRFHMNDVTGATAFLHVAGQSSQKGTPEVLALWLRHPEWPRLTIIARHASGVSRPANLPSNVTFYDEFLEDDVVLELQNKTPVHLCPSEVEGFGHTLMEALSCGACVVTLDAPPMNELVTHEEGVLVAWSGSRPMQLATRYSVAPRALEAAIEQVVSLAPEEIHAKRFAARARFDHLDQAFRTSFQYEIASVLM